MRTITATCRTEACGNADHDIPLEVDDDLVAVCCGVCGNTITEVREG